MTDIGRFQQTFGRLMSQDQGGADVDLDDADIGSGLGPGTRDDRSATTNAQDGDLARRFADAMRRVGFDEATTGDLANKADVRTTADDADPRALDSGALEVLLASSAAPSGYQSPYAFVTAVSETHSTPAHATSDRIAQIVEKALKAEMAPIPGKPVEIALKLTDVVPGLDGLTVSMQAGTIDVVLQRAAGVEGLDALRASAAGLADSLRQRFGKRVVRIYERGDVRPGRETEAGA